MNIRTATVADVPQLVDFNQKMALETEGKYLETLTLTSGVQAVFDDANKGFYVVAEDKGSIVGGLLITFEWSTGETSGSGGYKAFTLFLKPGAAASTGCFTIM